MLHNELLYAEWLTDTGENGLLQTHKIWKSKQFTLRIARVDDTAPVALMQVMEFNAYKTHIIKWPRKAVWKTTFAPKQKINDGVSELWTHPTSKYDQINGDVSVSETNHRTGFLDGVREHFPNVTDIITEIQHIKEEKKSTPDYQEKDHGTCPRGIETHWERQRVP
jgi:hypothetical protein